MNRANQISHNRSFGSRTLLLLISLFIASFTVPARGQEDSEPATAPSEDAATAGKIGAPADRPESGFAGEPTVSWKHLPIRILQDQKVLWLFPVQWAHGRHLLPTVTVTGVTAGLIAADPYDEPYFRRTSAFEGFTDAFNGTTTGVVSIGVPISFLVVGLLRKDSYAEQTALLAGEAYLDSAIPHVVLKLVSRRLRPVEVAPQATVSDTFFRSSVGVLGKGSSFPSGHAAGAFSIATVVARRYSNHRWVPWVAYGLAGVISFSRVPTLSHFPSDVFLGAALGYTITRYDVFRMRSR